MIRPCVVVPGIKGTSLENYYPIDVETTWSAVDAVLGPSFETLSLDPDAEVDLGEHVLNRASQVFSVAYGSLVKSLRGRSSAPVFVFPYDWRLSNATNGRRLLQFVQLLHRKRLPSVPDWGNNKTLAFVCHSMGGLVFKAFLKEWSAIAGAPPAVDRVAFVATPHLGSLDAVEAMSRGETALFQGRKELRKLARTFPGVYELLPTFPSALVDQHGASLDVFDAANWQANVTLPTPERQDVEQARLTMAKKVLDELADPLDPKYGLAGRVLAIYGERNESTHQSVTVLPNLKGVRNWFDFDHSAKGPGDEVVPVVSAQLVGAGATSVRIPWSEVSYVFDFTAKVVNFHAFMTSIDEVQTVVARFLNGEPTLTPRNLGP